MECESDERQPMAIHAGPRRKHRRNAGTRLCPHVSATLRTFNAISRDCKCGKKCLQAAVGIFNHDIVIECVKYYQSEVFDKRHDDKFMIMRLKVEGMLRWLILIHCFIALIIPACTRSSDIIKAIGTERRLVHDFAIGKPGEVSIRVCR